MDRLIVNYVRDPLDPLLDRDIREFPVGTSIRECLDAFEPAFCPAVWEPAGAPVSRAAVISTGGRNLFDINTSTDYVININGMILSETADLANCRPTGVVVICPISGSGKDVLRAVMMLVVVIVAPYLGAEVGLALGFTTYASQVGTAIVLVAGSLLVNVLVPPAPSTGVSSDYSKSGTYGWDVAGNADAEGVAFPVLYGTHRIVPPIVGQYVEALGDKQYLNILYAVADHKIDSIDETSIEINGNTAEAGSDNLAWEYRLGDIDQSVIQYFSDTRASKSVGSKIGTDWTTVETDGNAVEGLSIALTLPKGLYYANDTGGLSVTSVNLDIQYRPTGVGEWTQLRGYNATQITSSRDRWSGGNYFIDMYGERHWRDYEVGSIIRADHNEGDPYTPSNMGSGISLFGYPAWIINDDRTIWIWHWLTGVEMTYVVGMLEFDYTQIGGKQSDAIRRIFYVDRLPAGAYQVRVRFHNGVAPHAGVRYANDVYLDYIEEIIYDDFSYPGTAIFALRALATDKLSGQMPVVTFKATRATVPVWTGEAWEDKPADNPAWAAWDMLHNSDYGGGMPYDRIIYADYAAWAAYCVLKGYHVGIYYDSIVNFRKQLDIIGALGEGTVAQVGAMFNCYVDKEVDYPVQSFIFNAGNTMRESYTEEYLSMDDRANAVDVTFWDAENGYKRTTIEIPGADFDETTQEIKKTPLELIGCTSRTEAIKHGTRAINRNRFLTRTATWDAGIDSLGCLPWDPVVPPIGQDGRVVSATAGTVTIDREVLLQPGHTYLIRVKNAGDDTVEETTVAAVSEDTVTNELTIIGNWTHVPALYELYIFYEEDQDRGLMRVLRITRKDDHTRRITAIEYNPLACDDSGTLEAPEVPASLLQIAHLRAVEVWKGIGGSAVQLSWTGFAILWRVWYKRSDEDAWVFAGETAQPSMALSDLDYGMEYTFCVSHTRNPADGETATLTLIGTLLDDLQPVTDVVVEDAGVEVGIGGAVTCDVSVQWTDRPEDERAVDYTVIYKVA